MSVTVGGANLGEVLAFTVTPHNSSSLKLELDIICSYEAIAQFTRWYADQQESEKAMKSLAKVDTGRAIEAQS